MSVGEVRAAFPVLDRVAYLNAGSFGPLARPTIDALTERLAHDLARGRSGVGHREEAGTLREGVRGRVAELLGVPPDRVALTQSTTDACQIVLGGLGLGPHDEIVTTAHEHFGLLGPLHASGARVVVVSPSRESVLAAVGRHTRLLALSHVLWTTGAIMPLADLKAETGLPMLVDGAQSVGAIRVDAAPFDFYTVSGQKWLCGPDTTGALYIADPERLSVARPSYFSQESFAEDGTFVPRAGAARFDSGWIAPASLAGLAAALDFAPSWRFERTQEIAARCRERLTANGHDVVTPPDQSGLVSFHPEEDPEAVVERLQDRDVVVRAVPGTDLVRASCGYWTSEEDVERLVAALG